MVSSPSSVVAPDLRPGRVTSASPSLAQAPDVTIPLRYLLTGLGALLIGVGTLVVRPELVTQYHYHQHVAAVTHLFVLGFILSIVTGATYQLAPVVLETTLHSERLARWHFPIHVISVGGMVVSFWVWDMKNVGHFGSGLALGVGFFLWNVGRTLGRARHWTLVSVGIASSLVWLAAVVVAGLVVAAAKSTYELVGRSDVFQPLAVTLAGLKATADFMARFDALAVMHAHAHLGVLGVFVLLTIAVSYKLVPMFLISEVQRPWRAWTSIVLLNLGMAAVFLAILLQSRWKPLAALLVILALGFYGTELRAIVRARRRRQLDWGLRGFLTAQLLLIPTAILGLALSWPGLTLTELVGRLENAYGFLAILGVVAFSILGMLHKILPFLVWFAAYSREVGRSKTPALHEMASPRLQAVGYAAWLAGLAVTLAGILLASTSLSRAGLVLLAAGLAFFFAQALQVLRHLVRPQLQPLPGPSRIQRASQP